MLKGSFEEIYQLKSNDKKEMFNLLDQSFERVLSDEFQNDLNEKDGVILLRDKNNQIKGFSTLKLGVTYFNNERFDFLYSGDTIISPDYWGTSELPRIWLNFIFYLLSKYPSRNYYWILISKGYKTYRFLPIYFKTFFPHPDENFPTLENTILSNFLKEKFKNLYDHKNHIVKSLGKGMKLKPGIADLTSDRLKDPFIDFFEKMNPHHQDGDNLACITKLHPDNFKKPVYKATSKKVSFNVTFI